MKLRNKRALSILAGLVICLLVLEGAARLAGFIYKAYWTKNREFAAGDRQAVKISCLGDSFTFGVGAGFGQDYPAQLEKLLNTKRQPKKFICYNRGIPGNNSSMVLKNLVRNINADKPDAVILLIGSNDSTTLEDSDDYLFRLADKAKIAQILLRADIILSKSKAYKLFKILVLNLKNKLHPGLDLAQINAQEESAFPPKKVQGAYKSPDSAKKEAYLVRAESLRSERKFDEGEKVLTQMPAGIDPRDRRECLLLSDIYYGQGKYDPAITMVKSYIENNPQDAEALFKLGENYFSRGENNSALKQADFQEAINLFNRALACADSDDFMLKAGGYGYLSRIYFSQGNKPLATEMIDRAAKFRPHSSFIRQFKRVIRESSLAQEEKGVFDRLLDYNLGRIINLCHTYNIKIILLNYPREPAGGIREKISGEYKAQFVDVGAGFSRALSAGQTDLFSSDRAHPNDKGYAVMAETISKTLLSTGVF